MTARESREKAGSTNSVVGGKKAIEELQLLSRTGKIESSERERERERRHTILVGREARPG